MFNQSEFYIPEGLGRAYYHAIYRVFLENQTIELKINQRSPELKVLTQEADVESCALITAYNPYGRAATNETNKIRTKDLEEELHLQGYKFYPAEGADPDGIWEPEESYLILGMDVSAARQLAVKFEQLAFVMTSAGGIARVIATDEEQQGKVDGLLARADRRIIRCFEEAGIKVTKTPPSDVPRARVNFIPRRIRPTQPVSERRRKILKEVDLQDYLFSHNPKFKAEWNDGSYRSDSRLEFIKSPDDENGQLLAGYAMYFILLIANSDDADIENAVQSIEELYMTGDEQVKRLTTIYFNEFVYFHEVQFIPEIGDVGRYLLPKSRYVYRIVKYLLQQHQYITRYEYTATPDIFGWGYFNDED